MIADYWPDGVIDCKDYAVRNTVIVQHAGYKPYWIVTHDHVVVWFSRGGNVYIFDMDKLYIIRR